MDATIVAAMISSGTQIATTLFDKWSGTTADTKIKAYADANYNTLRGLISDNCMRILKRLEDGQNRTRKQLRESLYPDLATSAAYSDVERLDSEFEYRLFFLTIIGVITRPTREYYITEVGKAFVSRAREKKDYFEVLFR
jgi:hypothetical protein